MKILINPYPHIFQNKGGIQKRVLEHKRLIGNSVEKIEIFNPTIKVRDFDIVTTFKPQYGNYDVFLEAKRNKLKTVTHVIQELSDSYLNLLAKKFSSKFPFFISNLQRQIIENSDAIIALSDLEKRNLLKWFSLDQNKIHIVPNAINSSVFLKPKSNVFLEKYDIQSPYVLSVGRIEPNKNQLSIARALKNLGIDLILIGERVDKEYSKKIEEFCFVKIIEDINYGSEELISAYKNSSLFILASFKEISPNTVIEAGLCEIPVVCTKNTMSIHQYFSNSIEYIDPTSIIDITKKVSDILKRKNKLNTKEIVLNYFSEEKIAEQHLKIYNHL